MPRKPRFFLPDVPTHVVQRGNNRDPIFFEESDYHSYLEWLEAGVTKYHCKVYAYVLMTNHMHLLVSSSDKGGISCLMQYVGRYYVPYINHTYGRSGTLWEGRFKCSLIQEDMYFLSCMRYIELNPLRTAMVENIRDYRWSSYLCNAYGKKNRLISSHSLYLALGKDEKERRKAYRDLFKQHKEDVTNKIRAAWQTGTPLGNDRFKEKIEKTLKQKVGYASRGRPSKRARPLNGERIDRAIAV